MSQTAGVSLALLVPGLLGTQDIGRQFQALGEGGEGPRPLGQWLNRGQAVDTHGYGYEPALLSLFGKGVGDDEELPVAPLTLYADSGEAPAGYWMRADPVHLQADRDRVIMTDIGDSFLAGASINGLAAELNAFLEPLGYRLHAPVPQRWYLRAPHPPRLRTSPVSAVLGHDVHDHMPRGEDARQWRALLNEIQMLLHASEANRALQARGMKAVNSLWFWGGGVLPASGEAPWAQAWGDCPLLEGLTLQHGIPLRALPADGAAWLAEETAPGRHLVVYGGFLHPAQSGDYEAWARELESFVQSWCQPLMQAIKARRLTAAVLYPAHGRAYELTPKRLGRWWKRGASLASFLDMRDNLYGALS